MSDFDFEIIKDGKGDVQGVAIVGRGETLDRLLIQHLQRSAQTYIQLLLWGTDKEVALNLLREQAELMTKAVQQIESIEIPMLPDDPTMPQFYKFMVDEFEEQWSVKVEKTAELQEKLKKGELGNGKQVGSFGKLRSDGTIKDPGII